MFQPLRLLMTSLLAILVSAGLIGCAVFSADAATAPAGPAPVISVHDGHAEHGMHAMHDNSVPMPAHDHGSETCDGCGWSLLNRVSISPDSAPLLQKPPVPVFSRPVPVPHGDLPALAAHAVWPPGDEPPIRPQTLTHQKISLLI